MKIHIFNPEHDIALATNVARFTAPHAARQLRTEMGFLPALWAHEGDVVLVDDSRVANRRLSRLRQYAANVSLLSVSDPATPRYLRFHAHEINAIEPWGWDSEVVETLLKAGVPPSLLPNERRLDELRNISNRAWAARHLLPALVGQEQYLIGEAHHIQTLEELELAIPRMGKSVLKAPWSSSGRGIRYISTPDHWLRNKTWARNVISRQGGIMLEPYYNKVKDFGMEFMAHADGTVSYEGLSLFQTINGAYSASIITTENQKLESLSRYVPTTKLLDVRSQLCTILQQALNGCYQGPLGVDMMIVAGNDSHFLLHPCVELNLRRTMGHVSLSFHVEEAQPVRLMRIYYTGKYHFRVSMVKKT